jgi:3-methyladenine DNA glycosylase AlkD
MTATEVMKALESYGGAQTKKNLMNHGAKEPFFGVKVADLKKILKKTKKNHELSLELYATGNSDAMYLAALMADENKMTREIIQKWADEAYWYYLGEFAVPWVASETDFGFELGLEWIKSKDEKIAACGWSTLSSYAAIRDDEDLDIPKYEELLNHIEKNIHQSPNRVRHVMNAFVIAVGMYIVSLTDKALEVGSKIGKVEVFMGNTACKVPLATEYIEKNVKAGRVGKKRKSARC